jgi:plasmid stabilization system protein ParE
VRLSYSRRALEQIDKALAYVAERSPVGAAHIEARVLAVLAVVRLQPHAGLRTRVSGVRRIFLTPYPYLVDYQIADDEIIVLRFRHTSRNPSSIPGRA